MPEPRDFLILANLKAALQAIGGGAYYYSVDDTAVVLDADANLEALLAPDGPRPLIALVPGDERWEYHASGEVKYVMPVRVDWLHDGVPIQNAISTEPLPADDNYRVQVYFRGCADIEQAIAADPSRGGLAVDTRIVNRTWQPGRNGQEVIAQVDLDITIYRSYGDPA